MEIAQAVGATYRFRYTDWQVPLSHPQYGSLANKQLSQLLRYTLHMSMGISTTLSVEPTYSMACRREAEGLITSALRPQCHLTSGLALLPQLRWDIGVDSTSGSPRSAVLRPHRGRGSSRPSPPALCISKFGPSVTAALSPPGWSTAQLICQQGWTTTGRLQGRRTLHWDLAPGANSLSPPSPPEERRCPKHSTAHTESYPGLGTSAQPLGCSKARCGTPRTHPEAASRPRGCHGTVCPCLPCRLPLKLQPDPLVSLPWSRQRPTLLWSRIMDWIGSFFGKTWSSMMFCTPSGSSTILWMDPLSGKQEGRAPMKHAESSKARQRGCRLGGWEARRRTSSASSPRCGKQYPLRSARLDCIPQTSHPERTGPLALLRNPPPDSSVSRRALPSSQPRATRNPLPFALQLRLL